MLTTEAFNALLKTLEEPPPHVTFVLATTEPHKIPNTILSRCQRYDFKLVASSRLASHLRGIFEREGLTAEPGALELVVREAGGSVRDALSLCDQVISYVGQGAITEAQVAEVLGVADRALTRTLVDALARGDAGTALAAVDAATGRGLDEVQIARALVRYLRDVAVLQAAPGQMDLIEGSDAEKQELVAMAGAIEKGRVRLMFDRMLEACQELAESHETRMVLDLALIDLAAVEPLVPLGDLMERLGQMERRLAAGAGSGGSGGGQAQRSGTGTGTGTAQRSTSTSASAPTSTSTSTPAQARPASTSTSTSTSTSKNSSTSTSTSTSVRREVPSDPLGAWAEVIAAMEEARELSLASVYQGAKMLGWDEKRIALGFPRGAMLGELASEPGKVAALKEFLVRHLGGPITLDIRSLDQADIQAAPSAVSILEAEAARKRSERERRLSEARAHPLTQVVLDTFGAEIKEIKTDV
jgi:DNA polymerase-3 subunit gamma/tau